MIHKLLQALVLIVQTFQSVSAVNIDTVFKQMYRVANQSILFIVVTLGAVGAIMVWQAGYQLQHILGDLSPLGSAFLKLDIREFAPTITALMIATRYGAGLGSEIGYMHMTEQIDALRVLKYQPIAYLMAPRILACGFAMFPLIVLGTVSSVCAGAFVAMFYFDLTFHTYFNLQFISAFDVLLLIVKSLSFGFLIPAASCEAGLRARNGPLSVGVATTEAVIHSSILVLAADVFLTLIFYLIERTV